MNMAFSSILAAQRRSFSVHKLISLMIATIFIVPIITFANPRLTALQINTIGFGPQSASNSANHTAVLDPTLLIHDGFRTDGNTRAYISIIPEFDENTYSLTPKEGLTVWLNTNSNPASGEQLTTLESGKEVRIAVNLGPNEIKLILADKNNASNSAEYVINVLRPRTAARPNALTVTGANAFPIFPQINGFAEGALVRYNTLNSSALGWPAFNPIGTLGTGTGFAAATFGYHAYTMGNTINLNFGYAATVSAHARVTVGNAAPQMFDATEAVVNNFSVNNIALTQGSANNVRVLIETCHKDTYDENEKFIAEDSYVIILEKVPHFSGDLGLKNVSVTGGDLGRYTLSLPGVFTVVAMPSTAINFAMEAPEGVSVYNGTINFANLSANKLMENESGKYEFSTTAAASAQTINTMKEIDGVRFSQTYTGTITRLSSTHLARLPNEIVDFIATASQYTNGAIGTTPEKQLVGTLLSLGHFGGYISVKYNEPIKNDPKNPYGVDFTIYGNSFGGSGASEPGNVWVSKDGNKWYLLAGSDYFDNNTIRDYKVTYKRSVAVHNGFQQSIYEDNLGSVFPINPNTFNNGYAYPMKNYYPLYNWKDGEEDQMIFKGPLLLSAAFDPYGSASAAFPAWGYVDVHANGTVGGTFGNPYTLSYGIPTVTGTNGNGSYGNGFDISWAIDEETGKSVELDEISYIKVATASHIYAGAIGEKSTEITAILRVSEGTENVGVTTAPMAIKINDVELDLDAAELSYTIGDVQEIHVEVESDATVFINNIRSKTRTYELAPSSGVVRIVVQEDTKEPQIYYVYIKAPTYTIAFDSDGGTLVEEQIVSEGGLVERPTDPTKDGFTFKEWFSELLDKAWDFLVDLVTGDDTLIAIWEENSSSSIELSSSSLINTPVKLPQIATGNIIARAIGNAIMLENLPANAKVQVYNLRGDLISSKSFNQVNHGSDSMRIPVQTKGIYFVKTGNQILRVPVR